MTPTSEAIETYRIADLRLRLLLLGDGTDTPGLVKGEESRMRVSAQLRHMRDAFNIAVNDSEDERAEAGARVAGLEKELLRMASLASRPQPKQAEALPLLVTAAEAAEALGMSVSSIYRAVRNDEIRTVKLADRKRGSLRIPESELMRLEQAHRSSSIAPSREG
jgi:excisionase family DNA binding protein